MRDILPNGLRRLASESGAVLARWEMRMTDSLTAVARAATRGWGKMARRRWRRVCGGLRAWSGSTSGAAPVPPPLSCVLSAWGVLSSESRVLWQPKR